MPVGSGSSGGGSSAGDIRAGGSYYEFLGRDGVSKVVDNLQTKVKNFDKIVKRVGGMAGFGGFLGGLAGGASMMGVLQQGASQLGKDLMDAATNAGTLRLEIERAAKLDEQLGKVRSRMTGREDAWLGTVFDRPEKIEAMEAALARAEVESGGLERNLHAIRKRLTDIAGEDMVPTNWNPHNWFGTPEVDALKKDLAEIEKRYTEGRDRIAKFKIGLGELRDPATDPALVGGINKATHALDEQITTWGLTGTAAQRAMFRAVGATDEMLKKLDDAQGKLEKLAETNALPPLMATGLSIAGAVANRVAPQDLPGWNVMLDTLSQVAGAMPPQVTIFGRIGAQTKLNEAMQSMSRGGFSPFAAQQRFGFGDSIQSQMLGVQKGILANTKPEVLGRAVGEAVAVFMQLR